MSVSLERLAHNQVLFREVNERLAEVVEAWDGGTTDFLCECSVVDCKATIPLDLQKYERIRSSSNLFVISLGHDIPQIERVVESNGGYALVEKTDGADLAVETDPRKRKS